MDKIGLWSLFWNGFLNQWLCSKEVNLNIPNKFSTDGYEIIPLDFLPVDNYKASENMYWFSGQQILRGAKFVKEHSQLFGVYISNYSCGPDSFIVPYFRKIHRETNLL